MQAELKEFFDDVLVTAIEGGIDHWADILYGQRADNGGYRYVDVVDSEEVDVNAETVVRIDRDVIIKGFRKVTAKESRLNSHLREELCAARKERDASYVDANGADCIVQLGLFGEIVFG